MGAGRSFQANFSQGQLSGELGGRVDLQAYAAGLGEGLNVIPAVTGGVRRRAGFYDLGPARSAAQRSRLIPFRRSAAASYMLEFSDHVARVWTVDGALVLSGGGAYEFATAYGVGDIEGVRHFQSNDVQFLVHTSALIQPQSLRRTGLATFVTGALDNRLGPFRDENVTAGFTLSADGSVGVVTLNASADLFQPGHVGALFRLREASGSAAGRSWAPATTFEPGEIGLSDGKIYRSRTGVSAKTGNSPPLHDTGAVYDGGVNWEFMHDGAGVVRIDAVTSPTVAIGTVLARLPSSTIDAGKLYLTFGADNPPVPATEFWSEGAWSNVRGWPTAVEADDERLIFAGGALDPGGFYATRTAGFGPDWADFKPGLGTGRVVDDDAISKTVGAGGDPITWMVSGPALMIGATTKERAVIGQTSDDPITPGATRFRPLSGVGSEPVQAVLAEDSVIFVARGGRGVRAVEPSETGAYSSRNLGLFAEDLMGERIVELAWAAHPDGVLWARTGAGNLLSCAYDPHQNVTAWTRHVLAGGWTVESLAVLADDEGRDLPWIVVSRVKNAVTQRRVWTQAPRWTKGRDLSEAVYLDAAETYSGGAVAALGGLDHLEGETVCIFGDGGRVVQDTTVIGGVATLLDETVTQAVVGLRFTSRARSLPLDVSRSGRGRRADADRAEGAGVPHRRRRGSGSVERRRG